MSIVKRICEISGRLFEICEAEQEHVRRLNELMPQLKGKIPLPALHPVESIRRACCHGNYFFLFRGKSGYSSASQITRYHPSLHKKICTPDEFWSDAIDNTESGRSYDFTRPFFEQLGEVFADSYLLPLIQINCEGSEYINGGKNVRNSYLCFDILESEDCLYCFAQYSGTDNICCVLSRGSRYCYECLNINNCYECQHCTDCTNSSGCFGCFDCIGCADCFGSAGLRNVRYHAFNEDLGKDGYTAFIDGRNLGDYAVRRSEVHRCREFFASTGHQPNYMVNTEDCSGNYLRDSKNALNCSFSHRLENCGYLVNSKNSSNCWRGMAIDSEFSYQSVPVGSSLDLYGYANVGGENNVYALCMEHGCSQCFGCAGLKRKSYCILNKQYPKQEYLELLPRIIEHMKRTNEWGKGLPPELSLHALKHSVANVFVEPLAEDEARRRGYICQDLELDSPLGMVCGSSVLSKNPSDIKEDDIMGKVFSSEKSGRLFNIQRRELAFHKHFSIPLPRLHWHERIEELWTQRTRVSEN